MSEEKNRIEIVNIAQIKPYWRNPRDNNEKAVEIVKKSIKDYGYNNLIQVDKNYVIIVGHTRYKALMELGYQEIKIMVLPNLTEQQVKEYRIADNKTSEFSIWTGDLDIELREIDDLAKMKDYFTEKDVTLQVAETMGLGAEFDITKDDIDKQTDFASRRFSDMTAAKDRKEDIICPHCGESFKVQY